MEATLKRVMVVKDRLEAMADAMSQSGQAIVEPKQKTPGKPGRKPDIRIRQRNCLIRELAKEHRKKKDPTSLRLRNWKI